MKDRTLRHPCCQGKPLRGTTISQPAEDGSTYLVFSQPRDGSLDLRRGLEQPLIGSLRSGGQVEAVIQEHDSDNDGHNNKGDAPDEVGKCGFCGTPARGVVRPAFARSLYAKSSVGSSFPEMERSESNGDEGSVASLIFEPGRPRPGGPMTLFPDQTVCRR